MPTAQDIRIERCTGTSVGRYIADLARLRIAVFREYPYLYDGSLAYEEKYLRTYLESKDSVIVLALDGEQVVGASTGTPMEGETEEVKRPFAAHGYDPLRIFYFGESVLHRAYRGLGIGVRFFHEREEHARSLERVDYCVFCAVERPPNHPRRPPDYQPLDAFWMKRGYVKHPQLATTFSWREIDEQEESAKPMVFWLKALGR